ncbi:MAG: sensor histidine kinase, partial [Marmoricola sp.]
GHETGGDLAELGRLAGEQERELRRLIQEQEAVGIPSGTLDLASELSKLETLGNVTVSVPGYPVEVAAGAGRELLAVARACLDNVRVHVGPQAPAWILLQAQRDTVELSVRDEGPGIPEGRADTAARDGRLGIRESIRGRIQDLGGTATLSTGTHGTEWEFVVPNEAHLS